eukprot:gene18730-21936_t
MSLSYGFAKELDLRDQERRRLGKSTPHDTFSKTCYRQPSLTEGNVYPEPFRDDGSYIALRDLDTQEMTVSRDWRNNRRGSLSINVHELTDEGEENALILETYFNEVVVSLPRPPKKKKRNLRNTSIAAAAAAAAASGQKVWAAMSGAERGRILRKTADLLRAANAELADLETRDTGKPIQETIAVDVLSGADCLEYFAGLAGSLTGEHVDLGPTAFGYTRREPLGVVAGIGAWNYPLQIACWKSAPALACGNAMIFKPADLTPLTALRLAEIFTEAGLPPGVFNVVQGGVETGRLLSRHPGIAKISLTGAVETGRKVMADASSTLKAVTMELGGKSPMIVFDDAGLDNAVSGALLANFYSAGEVCSNGTRVFVHRSVRETFLEKLLARTAALKVGDPRDPTTQVGALISRAHMDKVL